MIKLNERMLATLGFDQVAINALQHFLRMVGTDQNGQTLPEAIMQMALSGQSSTGAEVNELRKEVEALHAQVAAMLTSAAALEELRKEVQSAGVASVFPPQATDWEHPGKLGERTPNTAKISTLNVDPAVTGTAAFPALYLATDTTTGAYRPAANQWGLAVAGVNVVTWSATGAAYVQNVSTTKQLISSVATGTAPLQVASTTLVANLHAAVADSLGDPGTYPPDGTDLATTQTLVNYIKSRLPSKGI